MSIVAHTHTNEGELGTETETEMDRKKGTGLPRSACQYLYFCNSKAEWAAAAGRVAEQDINGVTHIHTVTDTQCG